MTRSKGYKLIVTGAISAATLGLALAGSTFAHEQTAAHRANKHPQMTTEEKAAHVAEMKVRLTDALTKAVTEGKITTDQQTYILGIMDQVYTKIEAGDYAGAKTLKTELRTWLTEQNIDASVLPEMKSRLRDALATAVTEGKITVEQQTYILDIMDQIHTKIEAGDRDGAKVLKDELNVWLTEQNIDPSVLPVMKSKLMAALTVAVTEGKITEVQKTYILDIMDQIHAKIEADDHAGAKLLKAELKTYLVEQNIDASVIPGLNGRGHKYEGKDKHHDRNDRGQRGNNGHHYGNDKGDQHKTNR